MISGAYLGDKLSPLSETTVLTAQMVEVDVYQHIKRQVWTSLPAFGTAVAAFLVLGLVAGPAVTDTVSTPTELNAIDGIYNVTALNLLPLLLLGYLSFRKVPAAMLALMASALFAGVLGAFLQADVYRAFVGGDGYPAIIGPLKAVWPAMATGFSIDSGIGEIDRLLTRGGMDSMLITLWLIFGAVTFGTLLEEFGLLALLIDPMVAAARSTGRLFVTVFACGFGLNVVAGDQYIALVLPSRIFTSGRRRARRILRRARLHRRCAGRRPRPGRRLGQSR